MVRYCIAFLLLVSTALGQWTNPPWPSWQYPQSGRMQAIDAWRSITERCDVTSSLYPDDPGGNSWFWFMFQRGYCVEYKEDIGNLGIKFLQRSTNDDYSTYMNQSSPKGLFPTYGQFTSLASIVRVPSNWVTKTPYQDLCGLGNKTNDVTVGRKHGGVVPSWSGVNDYYPTGRTNFYTTDFGWLFWTNIVSELVRTSTNVTIVKHDWANLVITTYSNRFGETTNCLISAYDTTDPTVFLNGGNDLPKNHAIDVWMIAITNIEAFWLNPPWTNVIGSPLVSPFTEIYYEIVSSTNGDFAPNESWRWGIWTWAERFIVSNTASCLLQTQYMWDADVYLENEEGDINWTSRSDWYRVGRTNDTDWSKMVVYDTTPDSATIALVTPDIDALSTYLSTNPPSVDTNSTLIEYIGHSIVGGNNKAKVAIDWAVTNGLRYR